MFEIILNQKDMETLEAGIKIVMYNQFTGEAEASLILHKEKPIRTLTSELPTENVDNPVSNCS